MSELFDQHDVPGGLMADVLEELTARFQSGQPIDRDAFLRKYPDHAAEIQRLLGALEAMQQLAHSATDHSKASAEWEADLSSQTLGDYRIIREIGRGGMGVVYEAKQLSLKRNVALKVLPFAAVLDSRQLQRFKNESQAAAALRHPNIVGVYSVGCERGVHYYAMELVEGKSLAALIRQLCQCPRSWKEREAQPGEQDISSAGTRGNGGDSPTRVRSSAPDATSTLETEPLALISTQRYRDKTLYFRTVARLVMQAAEALEHAHQVGIVHRDIKPSNLLLDAEAKIWVTDFGLARIQSEGSLTMTGDLLGTLRYMSPEQAAGQGDMLDHRTDIYSLGTVLYELVTLQPLVTGDDRQSILRHVIDQSPPRPSRSDPSIPRDLETVILKSTAHDPVDRYPSAGALRDDLLRFLNNKPVAARRPGRLERAQRWIRYNRSIAALLGAVVILLALLAAGSILVALRATEQAETRAQLVRDRDRTLHERQLGIYARDMNLAQTALDEGDVGNAERILLTWRQNRASSDLRGFEWYWLWRKCHVGVRQNEIVGETLATGVAYSADGTRLAVANLFSDLIHVVDARNGRLLQTLPLPARTVFSLFRQPGTNTLVAGDSGGFITFWDFDALQELEDKRLRPPVSTDNSEIRSIAVSPDDRFVAVSSGAKSAPGTKSRFTVHVWDRLDRRWFALSDFAGIVKLAFISTEEGSQLVTGCFDDEIRIWDVSKREVTHRLPIPTGYFVSVMEVSDRGSQLAAAIATPPGVAGVSEVCIWDFRTWTLKHRVSRHNDAVYGLTFSGDGELLATSADDGAVSLINASQGDVFDLGRARSNRAGRVVFTPDDNYLCSTAGRNVRLWSVDDLLSPPESDVFLRQLPGGVAGVAYTNRGNTVCVVSAAGQVSVWDVNTGKEVREPFRVEHPDANTSTMGVSPDEKWLAVLRCSWPRDTKVQTMLRMFRLPFCGRTYTVFLPPGYGEAAFTPDSHILAVTAADTVVLLDTETGEVLNTVGPIEGASHRPGFSSNGRMMAFGSNTGDTYIYDLNQLSLLGKIKTDTSYTKTVAFSPDGNYFVTGGSDGMIKYWDAHSFQRLPATVRCPDTVLRLDFSPDGKRLLSASADGYLCVWRPMGEDELLKLRLPSIWPFSAGFAPDGSSVFAGAGAGAIVFRAADPTRLSLLEIERLPHFGCAE